MQRKPLTTKAVLALLDEYAPRWRSTMEQQQQHAAVGGSSPMSPDAAAGAAPGGFSVAPRADGLAAPHGRGTHAEHHSWSGLHVQHRTMPHQQQHQQYASISRQHQQQRPAECRCTSASGVCLASACACGAGATRPAPAAPPPPAPSARAHGGTGGRFLQLGGSGGPLDGRTLVFCTSRDLAMNGGTNPTSAAGLRQQARQHAQQLLLKRCGRSHRDLSRTRPECLDGDSGSAAASVHATATALQRRMSFDVAAMSWMMAARRSTSPGYSRASGMALPAHLAVTAAALG